MGKTQKNGTQKKAKIEEKNEDERVFFLGSKTTITRFNTHDKEKEERDAEGSVERRKSRERIRQRGI